MTEDQFTEETHVSWGSRIKESIKGILVGLLFFVGAFPLLFWNEGRAVNRYRTLVEGQGAVISVDPEFADPAYEGQLVHVSALSETDDPLTDELFALSATALRLKRTVEMYQWKERKETRTEKKAGGGEKKVTKYSYSREWSTSLIRSSNFKRPGGHENPTSMPFRSQTINTSQATLGAFMLPPAVIAEINNWQSVAVDALADLPAALGAEGQVAGEGYYMGQNPDSPAVGDLRIRFTAVYPGPLSVVAAQQGETFAAYTTSGGGTIRLVQTGSHTAEAMFATAHTHNRWLTWAIRAGGMLLMFIGLILLLKPLAVLGDVIPLVGNLIEMGSGLVALVLTLVFGVGVMGVAWLFYRPLLGGGLLVVGLLLVGGMLFFNQRREKALPQRAMAGQTPPPVQPVRAQAPSPAKPPAPPQTPKPAEEKSAEAWIKQGKQAYGKKDFAAAARAFGQAAKLAPDNGAVWLNLAVAYSKTGASDKATEMFKQAARRGHPKAMELLRAKKIEW